MPLQVLQRPNITEGEEEYSPRLNIAERNDGLYATENKKPMPKETPEQKEERRRRTALNKMLRGAWDDYNEFFTTILPTDTIDTIKPNQPITSYHKNVTATALDSLRELPPRQLGSFSQARETRRKALIDTLNETHRIVSINEANRIVNETDTTVILEPILDNPNRRVIPITLEKNAESPALPKDTKAFRLWTGNSESKFTRIEILPNNAISFYYKLVRKKLEEMYTIVLTNGVIELATLAAVKDRGLQVQYGGFTILGVLRTGILEVVLSTTETMEKDSARRYVNVPTMNYADATIYEENQFGELNVPNRNGFEAFRKPFNIKVVSPIICI